MKIVIPVKIKENDSVGVIAPSRSLSIISLETRKYANSNLKKMGLNPIFSKHSENQERYTTQSIKERVSDIHEMFSDKKIKAIFTAIGGYHSKQILDYIDWSIIQNNPKIFCGYSDTTVLSNAIFAKTGLVTYIGPHYSTFGQKKGVGYTIEYFQKCCFKSQEFTVKASNEYSDDEWWVSQNKRKFIKNDGPVVINKGRVKGIALGGNLGSFLSLSETEYYPRLRNSVMFLEVTDAYESARFDAKLQSLILQEEFKQKVKAVLIGRFQTKSKITIDSLNKIIKSKKELNDIPVIANLDFGHTHPLFTFPIGGKVELTASDNNFSLKIVKH